MDPSWLLFGAGLVCGAIGILSIVGFLNSQYQSVNAVPVGQHRLIVHKNYKFADDEKITWQCTSCGQTAPEYEPFETKDCPRSS